MHVESPDAFLTILSVKTIHTLPFRPLFDILPYSPLIHVQSIHRTIADFKTGAAKKR